MGRHDRTLDAGTTLGDAEEPAPESALAAGQLIARKYRLRERLGSGTMGDVWRARHEELNADVAIKFARVGDDPALATKLFERFRFEAQVSARLSRATRHIVAVHDAGRHRGTPYIVMELCGGRSLDDIIEAQGRLSGQQALMVLEQLTQALKVAHAAGIWHRDIKGANVMVDDEGDGWLVKLADFGVSKQLSPDDTLDAPKTTTEGMLVGTPAFMSPEQLDGEPHGPSADLWSVAVLVYESLTGALPFGGRTLSEIIKAVTTTPVQPVTSLVPGISGELDRWFSRALAKSPADRYADGDEMVAAFREAIAGKPARRIGRAGLWAALLVALVAAGGAWMLIAPDDAPVAAQPPNAPAPPSAPPPVAEPPPAAPETVDSRAAAPPASAPPAPRPAVPLPQSAPPRPQPPAIKPAPKPYDKSETL